MAEEKNEEEAAVVKDEAKHSEDMTKGEESRNKIENENGKEATIKGTSETQKTWRKLVDESNIA